MLISPGTGRRRSPESDMYSGGKESWLGWGWSNHHSFDAVDDARRSRNEDWNEGWGRGRPLKCIVRT